MALLFSAGALHHPNVLEIVQHPWFISAFSVAAAQGFRFLLASFRACRWCGREWVKAGEHARLLNRIVTHLNDINDEDRLEAARLEERLGHSMREMLAGVVFGGLVAFVVCVIWDFWK